MGDPFQQVASGEPVRPAMAFNAEFRNATAEAIRHARTRRPTGTCRDGADERGDVVWIQNISTTDRDRGDVMAVKKPVFTDDDNLEEYTYNLHLEAIIARECDRGQFVVLLDAIPSQGFGRAVISGLAQVRVDFGIDGSYLRFADVKSGTAILQAGTTGSAQILWAKSRSGVQPCVVRLSNNPNAPFTSVCSSLSTFSSTRLSTSETSQSTSPAGSSSAGTSASTSGSPPTSSPTSSPPGSSSGGTSGVTTSSSSTLATSTLSSLTTSSSTATSSSSSAPDGCLVYGPQGRIGSHGVLCLPVYRLAIEGGKLVCDLVDEHCFPIPCTCHPTSSSTSPASSQPSSSGAPPI